MLQKARIQLIKHTCEYIHWLLLSLFLETQEVRLAIEYIVIPGGEPVELLPRRSDIIVRQLELVESYQLTVENLGTHLNPRLQILPQRSTKKMLPSSSAKKAGDDNMGNTLNRLPFLTDGHL